MYHCLKLMTVKLWSVQHLCTCSGLRFRVGVIHQLLSVVHEF